MHICPRTVKPLVLLVGLLAIWICSFISPYLERQEHWITYEASILLAVWVSVKTCNHKWMQVELGTWRSHIAWALILFCLLRRRISILPSLVGFSYLINLNKTRISNAIKKGRRWVTLYLFFRKKFHPFLAVRQYCEHTHLRCVGVCVRGKTLLHSKMLFFHTVLLWSGSFCLSRSCDWDSVKGCFYSQ